MKVLIIDDEPEVRATLRDMLEINGHEVLMACDGREGVRLAAERPEFIFCDVSMPELDGHGVLRVLRQNLEVCDVPFVFLTARADRDDHRAGMALGACDYITKPFSERDILETIAVRTELRRRVNEKLDTLASRRRDASEARWSHELLTPLNAVLGPLELLDAEVDTIGRDELRELLAIMRTGAERQERLARKLIRYFELERETHHGKGRAAWTGRVSCVEVTALTARRISREAGREGDLSLELAPAEMSCPAAYLESAVGELVDNAFRYSPAGSSVRVRGVCEAGDYWIEVSDRGEGMSAAECDRYGAFRQFPRKQRDPAGLGIGLAIAQATATILGGTLDLRPREGGGVRAGLRVPL